MQSLLKRPSVFNTVFKEFLVDPSKFDNVLRTF